MIRLRNKKISFFDMHSLSLAQMKCHKMGHSMETELFVKTKTIFSLIQLNLEILTRYMNSEQFQIIVWARRNKSLVNEELPLMLT